ncbi:cell division protein DamX [Erwinia sp. OLTSP20]|uniref:SPOR domain-containing protein n=1 Tax=unclassified Erwinia TaxID=2622719 RepID=UPI000C1A329D|nr:MULTISPECIES: SPOR domain-containing protein [unclassified Erwinia]PIJ51206.1 cell division protein DamX [Erwinia sp. OAMSP11]PIJ73958.1 cell division protein DamX [Erwinia sp. OLSSP12]PIJ83966.1 cell division protein DamX [Erwinia sp. OLCASP19]PIJ86496.1 cell division protein DamX [Erwinia sp. OLMTSP26]PIJ87975.1 cell division protein DamX [Erwinia sp. OLMDSP33]
MDEFKPEDELKPDASDRRPTRPRKPSSANRVPVSRQRMMMGIGILVLLLLVIGIGPALNGNDKSASVGNNNAAGQTATAQGSSGKSIDLSASSSMSQTGVSPSTPNSAADNNVSSAPVNTGNAPQPLNPPPIASTPTEGQAAPVPQGQHRVELPGDLGNALSSQQNQVNDAALGAAGDSGSTLPTAPASVAAGGAGRTSSSSSSAHASAPVKSPQGTAKRPLHKTEQAHSTKPAARSGGERVSSVPAHSHAAPTGHYTLQLSGASQQESLNSWAKKQNLSNYHVYKTSRNGQPWYVLVTGSYATAAEAKRAVASLPAAVRAQNPWVKPLSQVKK